jgi:YVTN family beta-propeller protein
MTRLRHLGPLLGVMAVVGAVLAVPAQPSPTTGLDHTAIVVDEANGKVRPINLATRATGSEITVGTQPIAVAMNPTATTAYVANFGSNNVTPIDLDAAGGPKAGDPITVGTNPIAVAVAPDGKTAYVTNWGSRNVTPIDLTTAGGPTARDAITVGDNPRAIAITPDGNTAYVTNYNSRTVTPIDLTKTTPEVGSAITVGTGPIALAMTPDGNTLYVANYGSSDITPIRTTTNTTGDTIPAGAHDIAISPDAGKLYAVGGNTVTPIDLTTSTPTIRTAIGVGADALSIAFSPDGAKAYATNRTDGTVTEIDVANATAGATMTAPSARAIAITPDQAPDASFTASTPRAGDATAFDASASTVKFGSIAKYEWEFGDGQKQTTTVSSTSHTYATAGDYTAKLTTTSSAGTSTTRLYTGQSMIRNGRAAAMTTLAAAVNDPDAPAYTAVAIDEKLGKVRPIDLKTHQPGPAIDVGGRPLAVAMNPTATTAYVANYDATVTPIDLDAAGGPAKGTPIPVGPGPIAIAVAPNGDKAYVVNNGGTGTVTRIDLNAAGGAKADAEIDVGPNPRGIAITPDGTKAYVATMGSNKVSQIDLQATTPTVVRTIDVPGGPIALAITANANTLYVATYGNGMINAIDLTNAELPIVASAPGGVNDIAISPDHSTLYTAGANSITALDITNPAALTQTNSITVGTSITGVAFSPDGTKAYATDHTSGTVTAINTTTATTGTTIPANGAYAIAITPDQAPDASFTASTPGYDNQTMFNASASTVRYGSIRYYDWDFGDGQTKRTTTPTAGHIYPKNAAYTATLTTTSSAGTSTTRLYTGQSMIRNGRAKATTIRTVNLDPTVGWRTTPGDISFPSNELDGTDQTVDATLPLDVRSTTTSGWDISATSTQFTAPGGRVLDTNAVTMLRDPQITCETTCTRADNSAMDNLYPFTLPAGQTAPSAEKLFEAAVGTGLDDQTVTATFRLGIPARTRAGDYTATWTFTLQSTP